MNFKELYGIVNSELTDVATITVGADIELFLRESDTDKVVPAAELIGGTKDEPLQFEDITVHPDNIMVEFGFSPASNKYSFKNNLEIALASLDGMFQDQRPFDFIDLDPDRWNKLRLDIGSCLRLDFTSSVDIDNQFMDLARAKGFTEVGCDPFITVYDQEPIAYDSNTLRNFRFAGGHIHIGYEDAQEVNSELNNHIIQNMDFLYLGFIEPQIIEFESKERMETYGVPGAFRHKPYGVEYRTPSNVWVEKIDPIDIYKVASLSARMAMAGIVIPQAISKNTRSLTEKEKMGFVYEYVTQLEKVKVNGKTK